MTDLSEVQQQQADYDAEFWAHEPGLPTIKHLTFHIGKLVGKISTYCEAADHGEAPSTDEIDQEIVPDLLIYAARLANDRGLDLGTVFDERTAALRERFSKSPEA